MPRYLDIPFGCSRQVALVAVAIAALLPSSFADVRNLATGTDYVRIQEAVDAAADGDTLLLAGATYGGFVIDGKALTLIALPGVAHEIRGQIEVKNLSASATVRFDGLIVRGRQMMDDPMNETAVRLDLNTGAVRFYRCDIVGGSGPDDYYQSDYAAGGHGVHLTSSTNVAFLDCDLSGGNGAGTINSYGGYGGGGGVGVLAVSSAVALYDSRCTGGDGGTNGTIGGRGGDGYHATGLGLFASGCTFAGGDGGDADDFFPYASGDGGTGLWVALSTNARLLDNIYQGGAAGTIFGGTHGEPGLPNFWEGGPLNEVPGTRRSLTVERSFIGDGEDWSLRVEGEPGDTVFLAFGRVPTFDFVTSPPGVRLVNFPSYLPVGWGVVIGPSGAADFLLSSLELPPDSWASYTVQAIVIPAVGMWAIGGSVFLTAMDDEALPDCNGNGRLDLFDIALGLEADCNGDFEPDGCTTVTADCNGNGLDDLLDIECEFSEDLNENGIPDECEVGLTIHVNASAPPGGDGSLAAPLDNLGDAFDLALDGWTIKVFDGVYTGPQNRDLDFHGRNLDVFSLGGSAACIIDLQQSGRAFTTAYGGIAHEVRIAGFTIENGLSYNAGGLSVGNGTDATVEDCVFRGCEASNGPGALRSTGRTDLYSCVFENNRGSSGGAIYATGRLRVTDTRFDGNSATFQGGAICLVYQSGGTVNVIAHCIFRNNTAVMRGGALAHLSASLKVDNCFFARNVATAGGGGAIWNFGAPLFITSTTLVKNEAVPGSSYFQGGGAVFVGQNGWTSIRNSILWDNVGAAGPAIKVFGTSSIEAHLDIDFIDLAGGVAAIDVTFGDLTIGAAVIDQDPVFMNSALGDYRLGAGSPCVDSGSDPALADDLLDIDGNGNTDERVPLDLLGNPREVDDPAATDSGSGRAPITDMGALERMP